MDEQELEAALSLLMADAENAGADGHEIFMRLQAILNGMRAHGMPLPQDLVEMEANMAKEFAIPEAPESAKREKTE